MLNELTIIVAAHELYKIMVTDEVPDWNIFIYLLSGLDIKNSWREKKLSEKFNSPGKTSWRGFEIRLYNNLARNLLVTRSLRTPKEWNLLIYSYWCLTSIISSKTFPILWVGISFYFFYCNCINLSNTRTRNHHHQHPLTFSIIKFTLSHKNIIIHIHIKVARDVSVRIP